jgi:hypothetical protein
MARKETKSIEVAPGEVDKTTELWESFGWELKNKQTIKTKDSHQERRGDTIYNVTESEHYVELMFQRDTGMNNYEELVALEEKYNLPEPTEPYKPVRFGMLWLVLSIGGLFLGTIPGIIIIIWRFIRYSKKIKIWKIENETYQAEYKAYMQELDKILKQAQALI